MFENFRNFCQLCFDISFFIAIGMSASDKKDEKKERSTGEKISIIIYVVILVLGMFFNMQNILMQ